MRCVCAHSSLSPTSMFVHLVRTFHMVVTTLSDRKALGSFGCEPRNTYLDIPPSLRTSPKASGERASPRRNPLSLARSPLVTSDYVSSTAASGAASVQCSDRSAMSENTRPSQVQFEFSSLNYLVVAADVRAWTSVDMCAGFRHGTTLSSACQ